MGNAVPVWPTHKPERAMGLSPQANLPSPMSKMLIRDYRIAGRVEFANGRARYAEIAVRHGVTLPVTGN